MEKKQIVDELATDIFSMLRSDTMSRAMASMLYGKGWRKQSEWISVDERLPENGTERVMVFLRDNPVTATIGINKIDTDRYLDGKWVRWGKYVTYWMPLPEAPKMKGGAE